MNDELKPCPFCGYNKDHQIVKSPLEIYQYMCDHCGARGAIAETKILATAEWNKRVTEVLNERH